MITNLLREVFIKGQMTGGRIEQLTRVNETGHSFPLNANLMMINFLSRDEYNITLHSTFLLSSVSGFIDSVLAK